VNSSLRGVLVGTLALSAAQLIISTKNGNNVLEVAHFPAQWLNDFMSPDEPLIPDGRGKPTGDSKADAARANYVQQVALAGTAPAPNTLPPSTPVPPPANLMA